MDLDVDADGAFDPDRLRLWLKGLDIRKGRSRKNDQTLRLSDIARYIEADPGVLSEARAGGSIPKPLRIKLSQFILKWERGEVQKREVDGRFVLCNMKRLTGYGQRMKVVFGPQGARLKLLPSPQEID